MKLSLSEFKNMLRNFNHYSNGFLQAEIEIDISDELKPIYDLIEKLKKRNIVFQDTASIDFTKIGDWMNEVDSVITIKGDVKVSKNSGNAILLKSDGIFVQDQTTLINSLLSKVDELESRIHTIETTLINIDNELTSLRTLINNNVTYLEGRIDDVGTDVANLTVELTRTNQNVSNLFDSLNSISEKVMDLVNWKNNQGAKLITDVSELKTLTQSQGEDISTNIGKIATLEQTVKLQQINIDTLVSRVKKISPKVILGNGQDKNNIKQGNDIPFGKIYRISDGLVADDLPFQIFNDSGILYAKRNCTLFLQIQVKVQFNQVACRYCYVDFQRVTLGSTVNYYNGARIGNMYTKNSGATNQAKDFQFYQPATLGIDLKEGETLNMYLGGLDGATLYYGQIRDSLVTVMSDSINN